MQIAIKYQPTEMRATKFWFNALTGTRHELMFECEHHLVDKTAPQNYMTFEGIKEYDECWRECVDCGRQWDLAGVEL